MTTGTGNIGLVLNPASNRDGSLTLAVEFRRAEDAEDIALWAASERRVKLGETVRFLGLTSSSDKALRKAVRECTVVKDRGAYTAYYLDITAEKITY